MLSAFLHFERSFTVCEITLYGPALSFATSVMVFHNQCAILQDVIQEVMSSKLC
jgi:hypothetical protein